MWVRKVPGTRAGVEPGLGLRQALGQALAVRNISKLLSCCFIFACFKIIFKKPEVEVDGFKTVRIYHLF